MATDTTRRFLAYRAVMMARLADGPLFSMEVLCQFVVFNLVHKRMNNLTMGEVNRLIFVGELPDGDLLRNIFIPVGGLIGSPGFDVARERGGYGIWVDIDGYYLLPDAADVMLTSVMKNMEQSVFDVIKDAQAGEFKGCGVYVGCLDNNGVGIAPYHTLEDAVPDDLKAEIEDLKQKIISGEIEDTGCLSYPEHCPGGLYD